MARINGTLGAFTFADGPSKGCKKWNLNQSLAIGKYVDWDDSADGNNVVWENAIAGGIGSWDGQITANYDPTGTIPGLGATGTGTFQTTTGDTWTGTIHVSGIALDIELSETVREITFDITGSGALTPPS